MWTLLMIRGVGSAGEHYDDHDWDCEHCDDHDDHKKNILNVII